MQENQLAKYIKELMEYPDETVSSAFLKTTVQSQIAALSSAPEALCRKFVAKMSMDNVITLTQSIYNEKLRYTDEIVLGVYAQLAATLKDSDTKEEKQRKDQMLVRLYNAMGENDKKCILLETLETINADTAQIIRSSIIDEWTLLNSEDQSIQRLIREIDNRQLAIYMQKSSEELQQKFFDNMSGRLVEMMKEDMIFIGTVSDSDYRQAADQIYRVYRLLEEAGEIILPKRT